jgi:ribonuclease D
MVREGDVSENTLRALVEGGPIAWDVETSGLDWNSDRIGTCQLYSRSAGPIVVQLEDRVPTRLCGLLRDAGITKVFHHAMFDLRFMRAQWGVQARNVRCTKIASKLIDPELPADAHSLRNLLRQIGIEISKDLQVSDWVGAQLSDEQLAYAANDVRYLSSLLAYLEDRARHQGLAELLERCFDHIPTRVELDVRGYSDVYTY